MFVIRLPNGNLLVPESAIDPEGRVAGDACVEIGPADPEYARLAAQAVTEQEARRRRRRWEEADEALGREFERFLAEREQAGPRGAGPQG